MKEYEKHFITKESSSFLGLLCIGIFCFLYSIFISNFAEIHFRASFLNFPVFIGEILLLFCGLLCIARWRMFFSPFQRWHIVLLIYIGWVLVKAFHGYFIFGPLAFRNAALFYYPLFGFFGYSFYDRSFFRRRYFFLVLPLLGGMLALGMVNDYFALTYIFLFIILVLCLPQPWMKGAGVLFIAVLATLNYQLLFCGNRSHLVGVVAALSFISFYTVFIMTRLRLIYKAIVFFVIILTLGLGISKYSDKNAVKSLLVSSPLAEGLKELNSILEVKKNSFQSEDIQAKLFHDNRAKDKTVVEPSQVYMDEKNALILAIKTAYLQKAERTAGELIRKDKRLLMRKISLLLKESMDQFEEKLQLVLKKDEIVIAENVKKELEKQNKEFLKKIQEEIKPSPILLEASACVIDRQTIRLIKKVNDESKKNTIEVLKNLAGEEVAIPIRDRSLGIAYGNMIFRILIWRDMIDELWAEKAVWGMNWGKPQRSKSLEILKIAEKEWKRDGWITSHNSYLHIVYRAGIIGVFLVICIFAMMGMLLINFCRAKSIIGGLLVSSFVYWLTISNFLVFLELPYNAIPFWSLFGMMLAYGENIIVNEEGK